jgi:ParB family transcriptional regulator, chromosome partitioning protein
MTRLPDGKTRLDLVREGAIAGGGKKQGRLIVGIDRLLEDPKNERKTFRNLEGLIASIKTMGLIEPITVTPEEGEGSEGIHYRIITGHRRYRAAKAAGLTQVEVLIREPDDEVTRRLKSIVSNVQREDVGPIEMAEALQTLMDEDDRVRTQEDLARLIGKDKTWVSGMLRILTIPTELQEKVGTSQLSIGYDAMMRVARIDDGDQQADLVEALVSGASNRDIRQRIDEIRGKPRKAPTDAESTSAAPKPKRVYHTAHRATVIVQSTSSRLNTDTVIAALEEALAQARGKSA